MIPGQWVVSYLLGNKAIFRANNNKQSAVLSLALEEAECTLIS